MDFESGRHLQYGYIASAILGSLLVLYFVNNYVGILTAIKGGYVLIGLLLSLLLFALSHSNQTPSVSGSTRPRYLKGVIIPLVLWFPLIKLTGNRVIVLLGLFPIIYALISVHILHGAAPKYVLTEIVGVFFIALAAKYVDTYRFFGNGDLFGHTADVQRLVATGSTSVINDPYQFYPGLHIIAGSLKLVGGTVTYDAVVLTGIIAATSAIVVSYHFGRVISGSPKFGLLVALGMTVSYQFQFFGLYVFPQSLAVVLGFLAIYLALKPDFGGEYAGFGLANIIVMAAMAFTHHFTFILFAPIVVVLIFLRFISESQHRTRIFGEKDLVGPRLIPLFTGGMIAVTYWLYNEHGFFGQLLFATSELILNRSIIVNGSSGPTTTFPLGVELIQQSVQEALVSIATPNGIYFTMLLAVFSLGISESLRLTKMYYRLAGFVLMGIVGSFLILKTPIAFSIRLGHPFTLFFSVVLAVGLLRLFSAGRGEGIFPLITLLALGTTAPIVAGGDLYGLHQGPDFYGSNKLPDPQRDFSKLEYESMQSTAKFIKSNNRPATSMWMSSIGFELLDASVSGGAQIVDCSIKTPRDALFYRTKWTEHQVYFNGARNRMIISNESFERMVVTENKIHTTGRTGMLFDGERSSFETGCI